MLNLTMPFYDKDNAFANSSRPQWFFRGSRTPVILGQEGENGIFVRLRETGGEPTHESHSNPAADRLRRVTGTTAPGVIMRSLGDRPRPQGPWSYQRGSSTDHLTFLVMGVEWAMQRN